MNHNCLGSDFYRPMDGCITFKSTLATEPIVVSEKLKPVWSEVAHWRTMTRHLIGINIQ